VSKKEELMKQMDEILDLAKKELEKVDPKTGLPGTLIDKKEHVQKGFGQNFANAAASGAITPAKIQEGARSVAGVPSTPSPTPTQPVQKSDMKSMAHAVKQSIEKCEYLKKQGSSTPAPSTINPAAAAGIQAGFKGATGMAGIKQGMSNLGSALGFGKSHKSDEKGVHKPAFMHNYESGTSDVGARMAPGGASKETNSWAKEQHVAKLKELLNMAKPNLPKSEGMKKTSQHPHQKGVHQPISDKKPGQSIAGSSNEHGKMPHNNKKDWQENTKGWHKDVLQELKQIHKPNLPKTEKNESLTKPVPKGVSPKKYDSCVDQVKAKSGDKTNPYAVCASSLKKEEHKKALTASESMDKASGAPATVSIPKPAMPKMPKPKMAKPGLILPPKAPAPAMMKNDAIHQLIEAVKKSSK